MDGWVIFLAGIIFLLIIIILIVYFFFYNRTVPPTAEITNFGVTLSTPANSNPSNQFMTLETILPTGDTNTGDEEPTLVLQGIPTGENSTPAQSWNLYDIAAGRNVFYLGNKKDPNSSITVTEPKAQVGISNNLTNAYVNFTIDPTTQKISNLTANDIDTPTASSQNTFILLYDKTNPKVIQLKSVLPQINGQDQYLIPDGSIGDPSGTQAIGVTIGVPSNDSQKNWIVNQGL